MPVALNTAESHSVRRVWLLMRTSSHERVECIVGRGFLIADRDLDLVTHDEIRYVRQVKVCGPWQDENEPDSPLPTFNVD